MRTDESDRADVDWFIFLAGAGLLLAVALPIVLAPAWSAAVIDATFDFITHRLGIVYIVVAASTLAFLLWVAMGRWGRIVLGGDGRPPAHSRFSWAAMLFCTGIGASLVYWGATEWVYYYLAPPFGAAPRSDEAIVWAASYGIFHWGPIGWALYCLPALALGCSYHLREVPALRLSAACAPVLGRLANGWLGRVIDLLFIIGLLGTAATGLGFGISVVASAVTQLTGVADGFPLQASLIVLVSMIIAVSVYRGLDRGIKVLSTFNAVLAIVLVGFVLLAGPTTFILESGVMALGTVLQNFVRMTTWTDPMGSSDFVESWTIFYWAWWIALGPFVGMFVCKISEGRTIRELIFGMLG
ncbi:MAG: BCCT family transporter, partial [Pseudomonadales bacterium]